MPELRIDPATGRHVLIAEDRGRRPHTVVDLAARENLAPPSDCPFCLGREDQTPPSVCELADRSGSEPWLVRVVPNLYPAIVPPAGRHEVVVESPRHITNAAQLDVEQWQRVLLVYRDRIRAHLASEGIEYAALFKNSGAAAGASLDHVHSQIISLPTTPPSVAEHLEYAAVAYVQKERCLFCELIDAEIRSGERQIFAGEQICAFTAVAGRQPYETWIIPRRHQARYIDLDETTAAELAATIRDVLGRLNRVAPGVAYNLVLCSAPTDPRWDDVYHWHWQLIPRTARFAGLEVGSGVYINTLPPEVAARALRRAAPARSLGRGAQTGTDHPSR